MKVIKFGIGFLIPIVIIGGAWLLYIAVSWLETSPYMQLSRIILGCVALLAICVVSGWACMTHKKRDPDDNDDTQDVEF